MQSNSSNVTQDHNAPSVIPAAKKGTKYTIGDKAYVFNVNMQAPLVMEFTIVGMISMEGSLFYTSNREAWVKEEYIHPSRKEAYRCLIQQAENEMKQPEGIAK